MKQHNIFETPIWICHCELNTDYLMDTALTHKQSTDSVSLSNQLGYQGHNYLDLYFINYVKNLIPIDRVRQDSSIDLQCWVNINHTNSWNDVHDHEGSEIILSGVFYVKVPTNSGNIRFYDPRNSKSLFREYYENEKGTYLRMTPVENMLIFFPPYLKHMVEPNFSTENRISIAFNIVKKDKNGK